jgi:hypothetical protein
VLSRISSTDRRSVILRELATLDRMGKVAKELEMYTMRILILILILKASFLTSLKREKEE